MAHIKQSRPDSGLGFQVKVLKTFYAVPSSFGSGKVERSTRLNHLGAGHANDPLIPGHLWRDKWTTLIFAEIRKEA